MVPAELFRGSSGRKANSRAVTSFLTPFHKEVLMRQGRVGATSGPVKTKSPSTQ